MRMKAKRKAERDRARRDAGSRLRQALTVERDHAPDNTRNDVSDDIDLRVERSLRGYDE